MLFTDVIRAKRDGAELSDEQIQFFVDGLADSSLPAEQVSSLAMAIFLNSMSFDEAAELTMAMSSSGTVLDWSDAGIECYWMRRSERKDTFEGQFETVVDIIAMGDETGYDPTSYVDPDLLGDRC